MSFPFLAWNPKDSQPLITVTGVGMVFMRLPIESPSAKKNFLRRTVVPLLGIFLIALIAIEITLLVSGMVGNTIIRAKNPSTSSFIRNFELEKGKKAKYQWRDLDQISKNLVRAILVAEDDAFFEHQGLDLKEMKASWLTNWRNRKIVRGGSTITMQLVKNLYLNPEKNPIRKLNEIILALDLEAKVPKKRILEVYLNIAEWGQGIYGAEAASQFYYGTTAKNLSAGQAAYLAAILPNPTYLSKKGTRRASHRQSIILRRMTRRPLPEDL